MLIGMLEDQIMIVAVFCVSNIQCLNFVVLQRGQLQGNQHVSTRHMENIRKHIGTPT